MTAFRSIRARMTASFAISVAILMVIICGGLIIYARHIAEHDAQQLLNETATEIRVQSTDDKGVIHFDQFKKAAKDELIGDGLVMSVYDRAGQVVWKSQSHVPAFPPKNGPDWRLTNTVVENKVIALSLPWCKTERDLGRFALLLTVLSTFVTILATFGTWMLVGRTLRPIRLLSRQANAASADRLQIKLSRPSEDSEISELVATLNGLLNRISLTALSKSRFYAAASHELRTPLQALLGHLELAINKDRTEDEYRTAIEESHRQTKRLVSLVQDLLLLSRLDSESSLPSVEEVDLVNICERLIAYSRPSIEEKQLHVTTDLPDEAPMKVRANHAEMMVRNLLENAVKYTSDGGAIRICLQTGDRFRLEIINEYRSAEKLNTNELFEPFYRPDESRNSDTGGNGLGLAICKAIAITNDWDVRLEHKDSEVRAVVKFGNMP